MSHFFNLRKFQLLSLAIVLSTAGCHAKSNQGSANANQAGAQDQGADPAAGNLAPDSNDSAESAPGVTARSVPTWRASGATIVGIRGEEPVSETKARVPRTRLRPPVSMYAFHTAGLISRLLLGADSAMRLV